MLFSDLSCFISCPSEPGMYNWVKAYEVPISRLLVSGEGQRCVRPGDLQGARRSRQRCPLRTGCRLSLRVNNPSSKGYKGIRTALNHTCITQKLGVLFIEASHIVLSILGNMQISQMIKNQETRYLGTPVKDGASQDLLLEHFVLFCFNFPHLLDLRARHYFLSLLWVFL